MSAVMASAVALPEESIDMPGQGLKRKQSQEDLAEEAESKRRRTSSGKNSPTATLDQNETQTEAAEGAETSPNPVAQKPTQKAEDTRDVRRKSAVADEKQRSKRLFGALLGNLNQPGDRGDRASKRRSEIEQRRKAELQKQDDERLEDRQRRLERLAIQRQKEQINVDEQNMHVRHRQMLNTAKFLQTRTEPKLYYRPWEPLTDEEDRIDDQTKEAQTKIDKELADWEDEKLRRRKALEDPSPDQDHPAETGTKETTTIPAEPKDESVAKKVNGDGDGHAQFEETPGEEKPDIAEIPESDPNTSVQNGSEPAEAGAAKETNTEADGPDTNGDHAILAEEEQKDDAEDEDHVVEGDEDTVIY